MITLSLNNLSFKLLGILLISSYAAFGQGSSFFHSHIAIASTVSTAEASTITNISANCDANVISGGGAAITARGV